MEMEGENLLTDDHTSDIVINRRRGSYVVPPKVGNESSPEGDIL